VESAAGGEPSSRANSLAIEVTKGCPGDCSGHGVCNNGVCTCDLSWGSADCSVGQGPTVVTVSPSHGNPGDKVVISYKRPINNGGSSDFLALYRAPATENDMATPLGFALATDSDEDSVETVMPSLEGSVEVHYIKGTNRKSLGKSAPFQVVFPCKDDCNGHGDCSVGICKCHSGYSGFSCDIVVPTAFALRLSTATVQPLTQFGISWEAIPAETSLSDYVGIFTKTDTSSNNPLAYEYTSMVVNGTAVLTSPRDPGEYVLRYLGFHKGFVEKKAESVTLNVVNKPKDCPKNCSEHGLCDTVSGECACDAGFAGSDCSAEVPTEWTVSTNSLEYQPDYWVEVAWTRPPNSDGNFMDMVGLYETGPTRKLEPVQYQYVGTANSGQVMFKAPRPSDDRETFEVQFINGKSGKVEATSAHFDVMKAGSAMKSGARSRVHSS